MRSHGIRQLQWSLLFYWKCHIVPRFCASGVIHSCVVMYGADEKKAFEDMLAEIEDDSDEENFGYSAPVRKEADYKASSRNVAESKSISSQQYSQPGAKGLPGSSSSAGESYQRGPSFQVSKEDEEIARFGVDAPQSAAQVQSEQVLMTKRWLMRSCSAGERNTMKCFVERERSTFGMQTTYRCYLENPSTGNSSADAVEGSRQGSAAANGARFLMSAKKRVVNKTSYYLISLDPDASDDRGSESVLGKVGHDVGLGCAA